MTKSPQSLALKRSWETRRARYGAGGRKGVQATKGSPHLTDADYIEHYKAGIKVTESGCWEWQRGKNEKGYGQASYRGKASTIHRIMYRLHKGEIPAGMMICHRCDNPPCCNPEHLYAGTMSDNAQDSAERKRHYNARQTHCKWGHEFTPENTRLTKVEGRPWLFRRQCKECQRRMCRERYHRRKSKQSQLSEEAKHGDA